MCTRLQIPEFSSHPDILPPVSSWTSGTIALGFVLHEGGDSDSAYSLRWIWRLSEILWTEALAMEELAYCRCPVSLPPLLVGSREITLIKEPKLPTSEQYSSVCLASTRELWNTAGEQYLTMLARFEIPIQQLPSYPPTTL